MSENYRDIFAKLLANKPAVPQAKKRTEAVRCLDEKILKPNSEATNELVTYYRMTIDHVLNLLANDKIEQGIRCFQLYASATIVQTPDVIFAIDLVAGKRVPLNQPMENSFVMENDQLIRLIDILDYVFYTHRHPDHADYQIAKSLIEAGKKVIVPEDLKKTWLVESWAEELTVLEQTHEKPNQIGLLKVDVLWDLQRGGDSYHGTPCNAYLIHMTGDYSLLVKGDINCALRYYGWLQALIKRGRHVNIVVGSPIFWRGVPLYKEIDDLLNPIWIPGHNWEFTHRKNGELQGNCSSFTSAYQFLSDIAPDRVVALTWGEYFSLPN